MFMDAMYLFVVTVPVFTMAALIAVLTFRVTLPIYAICTPTLVAFFLGYVFGRIAQIKCHLSMVTTATATGLSLLMTAWSILVHNYPKQFWHLWFLVTWCLLAGTQFWFILYRMYPNGSSSHSSVTSRLSGTDLAKYEDDDALYRWTIFTRYMNAITTVIITLQIFYVMDYRLKVVVATINNILSALNGVTWVRLAPSKLQWRATIYNESPLPRDLTEIVLVYV